MLPFSGREFVMCITYNPRRCHWAKIHCACSAPVAVSEVYALLLRRYAHISFIVMCHSERSVSERRISNYCGTTSLLSWVNAIMNYFFTNANRIPQLLARSLGELL
jgi:hypothetical protein